MSTMPATATARLILKFRAVGAYHVNIRDGSGAILLSVTKGAGSGFGIEGSGLVPSYPEGIDFDDARLEEALSVSDRWDFLVTT